MKSVTNRALWAKKKNMYIQPQTEVTTVNTEHVMQGFKVSDGGNPPDEGSAHAPLRGEIIP